MKFLPLSRNSFIRGSALIFFTGLSNILQIERAGAAAKRPTVPIKSSGQKIIFKGQRFVSAKSKNKLAWILDSSGQLTDKSITGYFLIKKSNLVEAVPRIISTYDMTGKVISVLVVQVKGVITTHSTICTHLGCTVGVKGSGILCPCHGSQYNAATGAVTHGPAQLPLTQFSAKEIEGDIYILSK